MQMPKWLRILTVLIGLNVALVGWGLVQRHLLASTGEPVVAQEEAVPLQEQLHGLESPEVVSGVADSSVPEDDPLLNEIRKHAAVQFPELTGSSVEADRLGAAPPDLAESRSIATIELIGHRLEAVSELNRAAVLILQLAAHHRQNGQSEQASQSLSRVQQLQAMMVELLSE